MSEPGTSEALTESIRDFMMRLREHFTTVAENGDRDLMVDRIFAAIAAVGGAIVALLPAKRRRDGLAETLFAASVRLWTRRSFRARPTVVHDAIPEAAESA